MSNNNNNSEKNALYIIIPIKCHKPLIKNRKLFYYAENNVKILHFLGNQMENVYYLSYLDVNIYHLYVHITSCTSGLVWYNIRNAQ